MVIEMPKAVTADKIDLRSLLRTASTYHRLNIVFPVGNTTSERWSPLSDESLRSHANDAMNANDQEIIGLFLEIEPRYSRTNRMLAEM